MGTRSTVTFKETSNSAPLLTVYQQYDGYLDGVGNELAEFLANGDYGNGISGFPELGEYFNGMGCLAASFVSKFKTKPGGMYIVPVDSGPEEYNYTVFTEVRTIKGSKRPVILVSCDRLKDDKPMMIYDFLKHTTD